MREAIPCPQRAIPHIRGIGPSYATHLDLNILSTLIALVNGPAKNPAGFSGTEAYVSSVGLPARRSAFSSRNWV